MSQWQLPSCESLRKMKKPLNSSRTNKRALLLASDCASFRLFMLPLALYVCTCIRVCLSSWPNQSNPNLIFIIRFHPVVAAAGRPSARGAYSVNADRRNPADPRAGRSCPGARHLRSQRWGQGTLARCFLGEYLFEVKIRGDYVTLHLQVRVKMNRMRLRIAQRLKDAQNTYAMLTTFNEIDMRFVVLLEIESTE